MKDVYKRQVLYRAAQDIYEGTRYIGAAELVDRKLASGRMFRLICRAMELARMNQERERKAMTMPCLLYTSYTLPPRMKRVFSAFLRI